MGTPAIRTVSADGVPNGNSTIPRGGPLSLSSLSLRRGAKQPTFTNLDKAAETVAQLFQSCLRGHYDKHSYPIKVSVTAYLVDGELSQEAPSSDERERAFLLQFTLDALALIRKTILITTSVNPLKNPAGQGQRRGTDIGSKMNTDIQEALNDRLSRVDLGSDLIKQGQQLYWAGVGDKIMTLFVDTLQTRPLSLKRDTTDIFTYLNRGLPVVFLKKPKPEQSLTSLIDCIFLGTFCIHHLSLQERKGSPVSHVEGGNEESRGYLLESMNRTAPIRYERIFPNQFNMLESLRAAPSQPYLPIGMIERVLIRPSHEVQPTVCLGKTFQGDASWLRGQTRPGTNAITDAVGAASHKFGWLGVVTSGDLNSSEFIQCIEKEVEKTTSSALTAVDLALKAFQRKGTDAMNSSEARMHAAKSVAKALNKANAAYQLDSSLSLAQTYATKALMHLVEYTQSQINSLESESIPLSGTPIEMALSYMQTLIQKLETERTNCLAFKIPDTIAEACLSAVEYTLGQLSLRVTNINDSKGILEEMKSQSETALEKFYAKTGGSLITLAVQEGKEKQLTICSIGSGKVYLIKASGEIVDLTFHSQANTTTWKMTSIPLDQEDQVIAMTKEAVEIVKLLSTDSTSPRIEKSGPVSAERERVELIESVQQALRLSDGRNFIDFFKNTVLPLADNRGGRKNTLSTLSRSTLSGPPQSMAILVYPPPPTK